MGKINQAALLSLLLLSPVRAQDDDWYRYRNTIEQIKQSPSFRYTRDVLDGGIRGDFIEKPNVPNALGQAAINFTPVGVVAGLRDFGANFYKSARSGFKEHKVDLILTATCVVSVVADAKKLRDVYRAEKAAAFSARIIDDAGLLVRKELPSLPKYIKESFDGEVRLRTFKKGEVLYRSPREMESALLPGRFFGTREAVRRTGHESLYNVKKFDNPVEILRSYQVKEDVTVYWGRVKNGTGYQVYVPPDLEPGAILKWKGSSQLK